jgi:hypothetical protein
VSDEVLSVLEGAEAGGINEGRHRPRGSAGCLICDSLLVRLRANHLYVIGRFNPQFLVILLLALKHCLCAAVSLQLFSVLDWASGKMRWRARQEGETDVLRRVRPF